MKWSEEVPPEAKRMLLYREGLSKEDLSILCKDFGVGSAWRPAGEAEAQAHWRALMKD